MPTFVIVDEAHSLAPKGDCSTFKARCRDVLREIATSGRKVGIYLILVSSRPDKLDPLVASEVGNLALLQFGNRQALEAVASLCGIGDDVKSNFDKVLRFPKGLALLLGEWTDNESIFLVSAMRRTLESALYLDPEYWASPPA